MKYHKQKSFHEVPRIDPDDESLRDESSADNDPFVPNGEPEDSNELDELDPDDECWDAFLADDDERDSQPEYGDFWPAD